ncbi:hypothetical protein RD792_006780 [Penstemon davidsonii]|uniref:Transmembrane protein n=1 Tax=Penstemon davidsonii TaxID=160366 RepID=A0ABR0DBQ3_9LAMI|nr:hypothetical protein RD792_006780 [Penstemon davidsonii]
MDTVEASNEFEDWEVLHSDSDFESVPVNSSGSVNSTNQIDSEGLIQVNYFSLESHNPRHVEELDDDMSVEPDNPNWIDPGLEQNPTRNPNGESGEFWSNSSSERAEYRKFTDFEGGNEMGFSENEKKEVGLEEIGGIIEKREEKIDDLGKFYSDSSGTEVGSAKFNDFVEDSEVGVESNLNLNGESEISMEQANESDTANKKSNEIEKRGFVWWKMPMEFIKYCVLRMSPVWTVSVAAAVMGFVILGRRLYTMKRRTKGLDIKVTVDDKKVSEVMSRAARLNEAFSVVKRVPVIRPSLPAVVSTTTTWPDLPVHLRAEAADSLCYEAYCRQKDPVYGSVGVISVLQEQMYNLQSQLAQIQAEIAVASAANNNNNNNHQIPPQPYFDGSFFPDQNGGPTSSYDPPSTWFN